MKAVIIYYSLEGNTDYVANLMAQNLNADTIKLQPSKEIPKEGFKKFLWGGKSVVFGEKPELLNGNIDIDKYDTIILGTPIWAGSYTPPINTFLHDNRFSEKEIYLFACHLGGGAEKCFAKLKERLKGNTVKGTMDVSNPASKDKKEIGDIVDKFCKRIRSNSSAT
jgi:flavodoxin